MQGKLEYQLSDVLQKVVSVVGDPAVGAAFAAVTEVVGKQAEQVIETTSQYVPRFSAIDMNNVNTLLLLLLLLLFLLILILYIYIYIL